MYIPIYNHVQCFFFPVKLFRTRKTFFFQNLHGHFSRLRPFFGQYWHGQLHICHGYFYQHCHGQIMSFTVSIKFQFYGHFSCLRAVLGFMRILVFGEIFVLLEDIHILRNHRGGGGSANAYIIFCSIIYGKEIRLRRRRDFFFLGFHLIPLFFNFFAFCRQKISLLHFVFFFLFASQVTGVFFFLGFNWFLFFLSNFCIFPAKISYTTFFQNFPKVIIDILEFRNIT